MSVVSVSSQPLLVVKPIDDSLLRRYASIAYSWKEIAEETIEPGDRERVIECAAICNCMSRKFSQMQQEIDAGKHNDLHMAFVCQKLDSEEALGLMIITVFTNPFLKNNDSIYIDFIATHPRHFFSKTNHQTRIHGIGRSMINEAVRIAQIYGRHSIRLNTNSTAIGFYRACGFHYIVTDRGVCDIGKMEKIVGDAFDLVQDATGTAEE